MLLLKGLWTHKKSGERFPDSGNGTIRGAGECWVSNVTYVSYVISYSMSCPSFKPNHDLFLSLTKSLIVSLKLGASELLDLMRWEWEHVVISGLEEDNETLLQLHYVATFQLTFLPQIELQHCWFAESFTCLNGLSRVNLQKIINRTDFYKALFVGLRFTVYVFTELNVRLQFI